MWSDRGELNSPVPASQASVLTITPLLGYLAGSEGAYPSLAGLESAVLSLTLTPYMYVTTRYPPLFDVILSTLALSPCRSSGP